MKIKLKAFFQRIINRIKSNRIKSAIVFLVLAVYYLSLRRTLFDEPYATVIESHQGELLGAKIARDGQWRFPAQDSIPDKFRKCIVEFEDRNFYRHPGFNPIAMFNAMRQNSHARKDRPRRKYADATGYPLVAKGKTTDLFRKDYRNHPCHAIGIALFERRNS